MTSHCCSVTCLYGSAVVVVVQTPIPTNKQGVEPKRPSRPVNITHICRLSPTVSNHIHISWASELGRVSLRHLIHLFTTLLL